MVQTRISSCQCSRRIYLRVYYSNNQHINGLVFAEQRRACYLFFSLLASGFKVVVVTHAIDGRHGVRFLTEGLKVYYLPITCFHDRSTLVTFFTTLPLIRYTSRDLLRFIPMKIEFAGGFC